MHERKREICGSEEEAYMYFKQQTLDTRSHFLTERMNVWSHSFIFLYVTTNTVCQKTKNYNQTLSTNSSQKCKLI